MRSPGRYDLSATAALLMAGNPADAQTRDAPPQQTLEYQGTDYNGEDFTRPENRFETRFEDRSSGTTMRTDRDTLLLRWDGAVKLDGSWNASWLAQIPVIERWTTSPDGATDHEFGAGDAALQGALAHAIDERWALGFGARLVTPTTDDALGSGKWQIMPGFGVRYSFLEFGSDTYFVPKIRYAVSFAGDPSRRNISEPQIAPTLNIGLPDRWFFTLYPSHDIRINYGDPIAGQTGRLFLPFDATVGKKVADSLVVSLEAAVPMINDYPVYKFKTPSCADIGTDRGGGLLSDRAGRP